MSVNLIWTNVQLMPLVLTLMGVMNVAAILDSLEMAQRAVSAWLSKIDMYIIMQVGISIAKTNTEVETA